ncbi:MAG: hypothetical protein ABIT83_20285, partial [Massilia sp.]
MSRDAGGAERGANTMLLAQLHLLLALIMLVRILLEPHTQNDSPAARPLALAFALYSLAAFLLSRRTRSQRIERALLFCGIAWISAMIHVSGGGASPVFPFYVLSVIIAAFRFGQADALAAALAAAVLFAAAAVTQDAAMDLPRIALRAGFLLALGALIASLGEANLRQQRRLALLREVVGFANPRFGVDRTVSNIMERCRRHFGADACLLVARRARSRRYELRIAGDGRPQILPADSPLCCGGQAGIVLFQRPRFAWQGRRSRLLRLGDDGQWRIGAAADGEAVADLCGASSFISVPLTFRGGAVRITLCATRRRFERSDAAFLEQIISQVLPAIENVYLLDRLASLAALRERRTIGRDLHDSAIQPYIGLNGMLTALRRKTGADNPVREDIEELA